MSFDHREVIDVWFKEIDSKQWWRKDPDFDALIGSRFGPLHAAAAQGELSEWREVADGCLAEVIVLDQFSRNIYRNTEQAFAFDTMALVLAQCAVARKMDVQLHSKRRSFIYMPYMHSESLQVHEKAVRLFSQPGLEGTLDFELRHKAIIDRFGRYPHRNAVLGRQSTEEEIAFLEEKGSSF